MPVVLRAPESDEAMAFRAVAGQVALRIAAIAASRQEEFAAAAAAEAAKPKLRMLPMAR
jgi:hypothetical protein